MRIAHENVIINSLDKFALESQMSLWHDITQHDNPLIKSSQSRSHAFETDRLHTIMLSDLPFSPHIDTCLIKMTHMKGIIWFESISRSISLPELNETHWIWVHSTTYHFNSGLSIVFSTPLNSMVTLNMAVLVLLHRYY